MLDFIEGGGGNGCDPDLDRSMVDPDLPDLDLSICRLANGKLVFEISMGPPMGCFADDKICSGVFPILLLLRVRRIKEDFGFVAATMPFNRGNIWLKDGRWVGS